MELGLVDEERKKERGKEEMWRRGLVLIFVWLLVGCGSGRVPLYESASGEVCGRVKVPLVLASKVLEEDKRGGNIHVWRVSLRCRISTREKEGVREREIEYVDVVLTLKGFVEDAGVGHSMEVPYVLMAKDEIGDEILGKVNDRVRVNVARNEGSGEVEVKERIVLKGEGVRVYPTVFVGLGLSRKDWRRYKDVVEKTGERGLLPGGEG